MMKSTLLTLLSLLLSIAAWSQGDIKITKDDSVLLLQNYQVYERAMRYDDYDVAKNALFNMIVIAPRNIDLLDSLARFYAEEESFPSIILVANDVLDVFPENETMLDLRSYAYESLGLKARAADDLQTLYVITSDIFVLYKAAFLQYESGKLGQALVSCDIVMENAKEEHTILFPNGDTKLEVPMKASMANLKGLVLLKKGEKIKAKEAFTLALTLAPAFTLPQENLLLIAE